MYVALVTTYSENWGKHVIWHDAWIEQSAHCVVSSVCVCVVGRGGGGGEIMFLPVSGSSLRVWSFKWKYMKVSRVLFIMLYKGGSTFWFCRQNLHAWWLKWKPQNQSERHFQTILFPSQSRTVVQPFVPLIITSWTVLNNGFDLYKE